jgi:flagellar hook protein FlgE
MSFQQGLSGLSSAAANLEVIANNISNSNTVGAKSSRAEFSDLYAEAAGGQRSTGIGSSLAAVTQDHTQGSISTTGRSLDLAINGDGYFQISVQTQAEGGEAQSTTLYSRNGQFKTDKDGWIVNNEGARLMGFGADETGSIRKGQLQELKIPDARLAQKTTSEMALELNLDASDTVRPAAAFSQTDGDSFNYSTSMRLYDAAGQSVEVSTYFRKTAASEWEVYVTANGNNVPATGEALDVITFESADGSGPPLKLGATAGDADQAILTVTAADINDALNTDDATAEGLRYEFGDVSLDLSGANQQAGDYAISAASQDGYAVGTLSGFSFDKAGILTARYTNGESRATGQLAIASFRNPQGLQSVGGNAWQETSNVGTKTIDVPGTGNLGDIVPGAVEESNVDLTAELVNLITAQRAYQANAQSIKTQDQVTQTFLNMR